MAEKSVLGLFSDIFRCQLSENGRFWPKSGYFSPILRVFQRFSPKTVKMAPTRSKCTVRRAASLWRTKDAIRDRHGPVRPSGGTSGDDVPLLHATQFVLTYEPNGEFRISAARRFPSPRPSGASPAPRAAWARFVRLPPGECENTSARGSRAPLGISA